MAGPGAGSALGAPAEEGGGAAKSTQQEGRQGEEEPFYVGFAISVYQNSGHDDTNWGAWERRSRTTLGCRTIAGGDRCSTSCNFWELFR